MTDLAEIKAAVLACRENSDLPVFATMTFEEDGRTFLGTSPEVAAITLDAIGADVLGINCSQDQPSSEGSPHACSPLPTSPLWCRPTRDSPTWTTTVTPSLTSRPQYAKAVAGMIADGVSVVGGCCGTTPAHMAAPAHAYRQPHAQPTPPQAQHVGHERPDGSPSCDGHKIAVIGERINPTGKKRLQAGCATATWTTS